MIDFASKEYNKGFEDGINFCKGFIDGKVDDLKERKGLLLRESSEFAMQKAIDELLEIRDIISSKKREVKE